MKRILLLFASIILAFPTFSTPQPADIAIYKGKKYELLDALLHIYPNFNQIKDRLFGNQITEKIEDTGCLMGYVP